MLLPSGLSVDFWWDAYETSNYITNQIPTNTDNKNQQLYQNTRITRYDGLILAFQARGKTNGTIENEEKSPIHTTDVIEMMGE